MLGATCGTFVANYYRGKDRKRETLGHHGELTVKQARAAAQAVLGRVSECKATPGDLRHAAKSGPTVAQAVADYVVGMKHRGCRERSWTAVELELGHRERGFPGRARYTSASVLTEDVAIVARVGERVLWSDGRSRRR